MTAKDGFSSAGQLGPSLADCAPQHLPIVAAPSGTSSSSRPAHQSEASPSPAPALVNPDLHRQSHSSSKLPAFRFTDRRSISSGNIHCANKGDPLPLSSSQRSHSYDQPLDLKNNNNIITSTSSSNNHNEDPSASTSTTSALPTATTSQNTSAALSLQPALALHAPSPPVSPNPDLTSAPATVSHPVPGADPAASADLGPLAPPNCALSGPVTAPDTVPAPATVPATTHSNPSHPTTHHNDEKHAASASDSASASATVNTSTNTTAPTLTSEISPSQDTASSTSTTSPPLLRSRSRASSFQPSSSVSAVEPSSQAKRPASYPDAPAPAQGDLLSPHLASGASKTRTRRSLVSRRSNAAAASTGPPLSLNSERLQAIEAAQGAHASYPSSSDGSTKDSPSGQRELILPKTLSKSSPPEERRASASHRPPVSYRPPLNTSSSTESNPVRVPPIRAFRSSGSRKSLTLDMNSKPRFYDFGDDAADSNHDRTLRALEGRGDQDVLRSAPPISGRHDAFDGDDTGDVFLKIAREEASRRQPDEQQPYETRSVVVSKFLLSLYYFMPVCRPVHPAHWLLDHVQRVLWHIDWSLDFIAWNRFCEKGYVHAQRDRLIAGHYHRLSRPTNPHRLPRSGVDGVFYAELNEFFQRELAEEGYSGVEVRVTPTVTDIIIRATHTQEVLGEQGRRIREHTSLIQKRFKFP
ncbi:hypothetical protein FDECE_16689, partial [Fusarium decemcellulare]